jgi:hypothetical protein
MAGITKTERDRRQAHAEACPHFAVSEGRWAYYPTLQGYARRERCIDCGAWWVFEKTAYDELMIQIANMESA